MSSAAARKRKAPSADSDGLSAYEKARLAEYQGRKRRKMQEVRAKIAEETEDAKVLEEAIKKALEENKKKNANKKKSKFQSKLEEAMKANEQARKNKKNKK